MTFTIFKCPLLTFSVNWNTGIFGNWSRLLNWKETGTYPQSLKYFKRFLKVISLIHIYRLAKFGDLVSYGSKHVFKNAPCLISLYSSWRHRFGNGMVKNTKTWISWERIITFLRNKKILSLYLIRNILRSYF